MGREYVQPVEALGLLSPPPSVILHDTIISITPWVLSGTGADPAIARDTTYYPNTRIDSALAASLKLTSRTTDAAARDFVFATRRAPPIPGARIRFQSMFMMKVETNDVLGPLWYLKIARAGTLYTAAIRHYLVPDSWDYLSAADTWIAFDPQPRFPTDSVWFPFAMAVDLSKSEYLYVSPAGRHIAMAGISLLTDSSAFDFIEIKVGGQTEQVGPDPIYFADIGVGLA